MASSLKIELVDEKGRFYSMKVRDGLVSLIRPPNEADLMRLEANVNAQSWPSFALEGPVKIHVITMIGAKQISVKTLTGNKLQVLKGEKTHSLVCMIPNQDAEFLRECDD